MSGSPHDFAADAFHAGQLYRSCNIKVLNIQITRSAENGEHNACAIFSLRLPRSCGVEKLLTLVGRCEGIVSVEEL